MHWHQALRAHFVNGPAKATAAFRSWGDAMRRRLPDRIPIASKLALVFTLLITGGMVSLGLLVGSNQTRLLEQQIQRFGTTLAQQAAEAAEEPLLANDSLTLQLVVNNLIEERAVIGAAIYSDEGDPIVGSGSVPPTELLLRIDVAKNGVRGKTLEWLDGEAADDHSLVSFVAPIRFRDVTAGYALLTFDRSVLEQAKDETIVAVSVTTALMVFIGIAASFYLGGRLTRPIHRLMDASRAISEGKYDFRFTDRRNDELGILMEAMNSMSEGLLRKEQVERVFSRYVSPQVARQVLSDLADMERVQLGGRHVDASVLFADIVGFTSMSEEMTPEEVSRLLNEYFTQIARAVQFCGGHIDKYMGDCAMIVFGVPEHYGDHAFRATACAWMIMRLVEAMNVRRTAGGRPPVRFRIGVNSGSMLAGNMGSAERMDYTVVGDAVNLASRLSHAGDPGQVVVTAEMCALPTLAERIRTAQHGTIRLRGKRVPVATYRVTEVNDPFREEMLAENRRIIESLESEAA